MDALHALPGKAPGLTVAAAREALLPHLSQDLFPGGDKAGWWLKAVQLDLEASLSTLRHPFRPRVVEVDGRRLSGGWGYDPETKVLRVNARIASGTITASR